MSQAPLWDLWLPANETSEAEAAMLRSERTADGGSPSLPFRFVFYVEGPRDQDILRGWARRLSPPLARSLESCAVILGGRRPERAVEHFRALGGAHRGARGLCVLDGDGQPAGAEVLPTEPGLEFFTWPRRQIESYLLVPSAIRRCLRLSREDRRVEQLIREHVPVDEDEDVLRELDAKRLLAGSGPLARGLGRTLRSGRIALSMREGEIHRDVIDLFDRVRAGLSSARNASRRDQL